MLSLRSIRPIQGHPRASVHGKRSSPPNTHLFPPSSSQRTPQPLYLSRASNAWDHLYDSEGSRKPSAGESAPKSPSSSVPHDTGAPRPAYPSSEGPPAPPQAQWGSRLYQDIPVTSTPGPEPSAPPMPPAMMREVERREAQRQAEMDRAADLEAQAQAQAQARTAHNASNAQPYPQPPQPPGGRPLGPDDVLTEWGPPLISKAEQRRRSDPRHSLPGSAAFPHPPHPVRHALTPGGPSGFLRLLLAFSFLTWVGAVLHFNGGLPKILALALCGLGPLILNVWTIIGLFRLADARDALAARSLGFTPSSKAHVGRKSFAARVARNLQILWDAIPAGTLNFSLACCQASVLGLIDARAVPFLSLFSMAVLSVVFYSSLRNEMALKAREAEGQMRVEEAVRRARSEVVF